jgi:hypothetical protein
MYDLHKQAFDRRAIIFIKELITCGKGAPMGRVKKNVTEELANSWLEQAERYGKSPAQIAKDSQYDARTVRKHLNLRRRALEKKEARQTVLRQALEAHQADLCDFAEKLRGEVRMENRYPVSPALTQDLLWEALRKHTPRSYLWRRLGRWNELAPQLRTFEKRLEETVIEITSSNTRLKFSSGSEEPGLNPGFILAVIGRLESLALDEDAPDAPVRTEPHQGGLVFLLKGTHVLALVRSDHAGETQRLFDTMVQEAKALLDYQRLVVDLKEFKSLWKEIQDELKGIKLRRLLPGSCLYCPC